MIIFLVAKDIDGRSCFFKKIARQLIFSLLFFFFGRMVCTLEFHLEKSAIAVGIRRATTTKEWRRVVIPYTTPAVFDDWICLLVRHILHRGSVALDPSKYSPRC